MSETDLTEIGDPMPLLDAVSFVDGYEIAAAWGAGARRGRTDVVDLAPAILTYRIYRPLRDNPGMLRSVHLVDDGAAIAWGESDDWDMAATTIERLAEEAMGPDDFRGWLDRNGLTLDAASAELGISRRLVAYYAAGRPVPRYIGLACRYIDVARGSAPARRDLLPAEAT